LSNNSNNLLGIPNTYNEKINNSKSIDLNIPLEKNKTISGLDSQQTIPSSNNLTHNEIQLTQ
jgi:hypothetical protein